MTDFVIRPARPEDAPALTRAIVAAYAVHDGRGLTLPPVADGVPEAIAGTPVFVAEEAGEILGGIILRMDEGAQIENVAVTAAAMGRGVGKALIARAEEAARAAGHDNLALATHEALTENLALYARLGWAETGRDGQKVLMRKPLTKGAPT